MFGSKEDWSAPKNPTVSDQLEEVLLLELSEIESEINKALDELEAMEGQDELKDKMFELTKKLGNLVRQLRIHDAKNKEANLN